MFEIFFGKLIQNCVNFSLSKYSFPLDQIKTEKNADKKGRIKFQKKNRFFVWKFWCDKFLRISKEKRENFDIKERKREKEEKLIK